jgi:hypothetical protein
MKLPDRPDPFAGEHLGCELFGKLTGHWSHHSA